ncbi:MAG: nucleotidyltransferase family protein [Ruminococcus sp.]
MTNYSQTARTLIYLLSCAVNEKECGRKPGETELGGLYSLAKQHGLSAAVAFALEGAGISERRFEQARLKAKRKLGLFDIERVKVYQRLNEAGIRFLPLKGIVMKDYYPRYGMREMSDNDILCDSSRMAEVREIMESLGYTCEHYGKWNHDTYQKPPTLVFKMHHSLFVQGEMPAFDRYYAGVFDRLIHRDGCEYAFSDEDFYLYLLAHGYKHFSHNGTGLRFLLDIYVYLQTHPGMDSDRIARELEKLGLTEFEQRSRELAVKLFGFGELDDRDREWLTHFMDSSLYGSVRQGEYNMLTRQLKGRDTKSANRKYLFDRVFLRGEALKKEYPFFARHRCLLPFLYLYSPFKGLFTHPKGIVHEIKNVLRYRSLKNKG